MTMPSAEAEEWHRVVHASVRECLETWLLQVRAGVHKILALTDEAAQDRRLARGVWVRVR